jgi:two-component system NarL family response regulator
MAAHFSFGIPSRQVDRADPAATRAPVRVLVADDFTLIRRGIRAVMNGTAGVEIVGEATTADDAVRLAKDLAPDIVFMDQDMPGDSVLAIRSIKESAPEIEVVMITDRLDQEEALRAVEAGATGYVLKDIPFENLAKAIRAVTTGRILAPEVTQKLVKRLGHITRKQCIQKRPHTFGLTHRELDILRWLAQGTTDRDIAARLVIAEGTVKTHVRNILRKLEVRNRTHAVAKALRAGFIE